jgi:hypothetical protein
MARRKSINIWVIISILTIAAWLLGFVTSAGAQTYTMKCRVTMHLVTAHPIEVGDVPGHLLGVGDVAGVLSCDDGSIATASMKAVSDYIKGSGKAYNYALYTYEDGSTTWAKSQYTSTTDPGGKTGSMEGTFEYLKGTGRFEGIQGGGTFTGKRLAPAPGVGAQFYVDLSSTYTVPSK